MVQEKAARKKLVRQTREERFHLPEGVISCVTHSPALDQKLGNPGKREEGNAVERGMQSRRGRYRGKIPNHPSDEPLYSTVIKSTVTAASGEKLLGSLEVLQGSLPTLVDSKNCGRQKTAKKKRQVWGTAPAIREGNGESGRGLRSGG